MQPSAIIPHHHRQHPGGPGADAAGSTPASTAAGRDGPQRGLPPVQQAKTTARKLSARLFEEPQHKVQQRAESYMRRRANEQKQVVAGIEVKMSQMVEQMRTHEHRQRLEDEANRAAKARQRRTNRDRETVQAFAAQRRAEQEKARTMNRRNREQRRARLTSDAAAMNKKLIESARSAPHRLNGSDAAIQKAREMLERKIAHLAKQTSREIGPSARKVNMSHR